MAYEFERKITPKLILSVVAAGLASFCGMIVETTMNVTFPTLMTEFGIGTSITTSLVNQAQALTGETVQGTINGAANACHMLLVIAVVNVIILLIIVRDIRSEKSVRS